MTSPLPNRRAIPAVDHPGKHVQNEIPMLRGAGEIAKRLGCSKAVVYSEAAKGNLRSIKIAGKLIRFDDRDVLAYINARRKG